MAWDEGKSVILLDKAAVEAGRDHTIVIHAKIGPVEARADYRRDLATIRQRPAERQLPPCIVFALPPR